MTIGNRGYINNYSTTLSAGIDSSTTSISVVDGAPVATALATYKYVVLTLDNGTNVEIVHATASASNVLTVVRAQDGTIGSAFDSGVAIESRVTRSSFDKQLWEVYEVVDLGVSAANIDFVALQPGSYRINLVKMAFNSASNLLMQFGTGAGPTIDAGANYRWIKTQGQSTTNVTSNSNSDAGTSFEMFNTTAQTYGLRGTIFIDDIADTTYRSARWTLVQPFISSAIVRSKQAIGSGTWVNTADPITAIRLNISSGLILAGSKLILERMRDVTS